MARLGPVDAVWSAARLAVAAALAAAVVVQGISTIAAAAADGRDVATTAVNYVSYFTILSAVVAAAVLAAAGVRHLRTREPVDPPVLATCLVAVTVYLAVTGAVYNLLLRATSVGPDTVGWANETMHVVAPVFLVVDLLVAPRRRPLPWRAGFLALIFPVAWIVYTLVRGPFVTDPSDGDPWWYPYPFLDPHGAAGWAGVVAHVAAIAAGIVVLAVAAIAVGRRASRPARP